MTITNFTPIYWQARLANLLGHLTQTGFTCLRKRLHTLAATSILRIKFLLLLMGAMFSFFAKFRLKLRVLASANKILNGTAFTPTGLTAFNA